jgi:hypothetical protein
MKAALRRCHTVAVVFVALLLLILIWALQRQHHRSEECRVLGGEYHHGGYGVSWCVSADGRILKTYR